MRDERLAFLSIFEKAVWLISTNCCLSQMLSESHDCEAHTCNLSRSLLKRRKPSSNVTYIDESFEADGARACSDRFLSSNVLSRSLS